MSFFDKLFGKKPESIEITSPAESSQAQPQTAEMLPDKPRPFGYKTSWICVKAKFVNGELVRGYGWNGGEGMVYLNEGEITPEEQTLGFDSFIKSEDDDWESVEFPDEESVVEIAAAWGVDPLFNDCDYPEAFGYISDK